MRAQWQDLRDWSSGVHPFHHVQPWEVERDGSTATTATTATTTALINVGALVQSPAGVHCDHRWKADGSWTADHALDNRRTMSPHHIAVPQR